MITDISISVVCQSRDQLEAEKRRLQSETEKLQSRLDSAKEKQLESQMKITELMENVERAQTGQAVASQQLQARSGDLETVAKTRVRVWTYHLYILSAGKIQVYSSLSWVTPPYLPRSCGHIREVDFLVRGRSKHIYK